MTTAFDPTPYVDAEFHGMVPAILQITAQNAKTPLAELRAAASMLEDPPPDPAWIERMVPGVKGAPDVRVYVINGGSTGAPRPAILHLHGGGFIRGTAKSSIPSLQPIARALDCVIVTVDYRLAPETPFPGALDDNYAALLWLHRHAADLGVDPRRVAVMGESAGGGHAAMLTIAARDRGDAALCCYQALVYPMLDDRTGTTRPVPPQTGALMWTPERNRFGWTSLLGVPAGAPQVPDGAVPARIANLKGLPPTFIGVGSIDLFVNEDIAYAQRLIDVGVSVEVDVVPGAFHGFDLVLPHAAISQRFRARLTDALRRGFGLGSG
jgi:acetyl esterase/lipase